MSAAATSAPERQSRSEMTFKSCRRWEEETRTAGGCCVVSLQRALACMVYVEMATVAAVAATITLVAVAARRRDRWRKRPPIHHLFCELELELKIEKSRD